MRESDSPLPSRLAGHLIEQMQNDADPRDIYFEFFAERANHTDPAQRFAIVERLGPSAHPFNSNRRDQILALPRRQLAFADSAYRAEHAPAHQDHFAAIGAPTRRSRACR